jgi:hypothetical protein
VQMEAAHGDSLLVNTFIHLMLNIKIKLCLEAQEAIIELFAHTSTHKHYVNKIIYIYMLGKGSNTDIVKCELHKVLCKGTPCTSITVCFRHIYTWKICILIMLGSVLFKNDEKM